jgi:colanic acid/amylovoran biosynthesis glycosyltransferase
VRAGPVPRNDQTVIPGGLLKRFGYLCSEFPALSHTFISREVAILEQEGFTVFTASINPTKHPEKLGPADAAYAKTTFCLKTTPRPLILARLSRYCVRPRRLLAALGTSLRLFWFDGPRQLGKALGYFTQAILLHNWACGHGVHHVHVHFANPAASVALVATRFGGLEFSLSVHGPDDFSDVRRNNLPVKVREAVFVRCIGHFCRSQLMRFTPIDLWPKISIVRCGVFRDEFTRRPSPRGPARRILCVGRVCPSKGQAILLEAAALLRDRGLDFELLFLGGGEDLESLREKAVHMGLAGVVTFAGPVGHAQVKEELSRADLFVLPSFAEGIPIALMEAMASGVPAISTFIAGLPELIEDGKSGFLTRPSDATHLAGTIESILRGREDLEPILARAADTVRERYDAARNVRELASIFAALEG